MAEEVIPNTRETLLALSARFPQATFIMETGAHSPWVIRFLQAERHSHDIHHGDRARIARG